MPHLHELYDFTVSAFIVYKNKILLLNHIKYNCWLPPGGHIELDEDIETALWREIKEETGLDINQLMLLHVNKSHFPSVENSLELPLPFSINVHKISGKHKHIDFEYLLKARTSKVELEIGAATEIGWFDEIELKNMLDSGKLPKNIKDKCIYALKLVRSN